ncbi:ribonuclease H-like domain-containing protein, partial [Tanacetum coccineum]
MAGEDDQNINNQPPNPPPPTQQAPHTVSTIKLPILKKGEYDIWAMKMEHYLAHTDYPVWEVIQNGNGHVSISTDTQGQIKILPPKSAEEILATEEEEEDHALMAFNSNSSSNEVQSCSDECVASYNKLKQLYDEQREQLGDASIEIQVYTQALKKVEAQLVAHQQSQLWYEKKIRFMKINLDDKTDVLTYHKKLLAEAEKEKEDLKANVEKWHNSSKNLNILLNSQMSARDKAGLGYGLSYENEVSPSVFVSRKVSIELSVNDRYAVEMHAVPPPNDKDRHPFWTDKAIDDFTFTYGRSNLKLVNMMMKQQAVPINVARKVNTVKPIVNNARPKAGFHKSVSPFRKSFNRTTTLRTNFSKQKVNTAEVNAVSAVKGKRETADYPQRALQNKGIVDSGCSRHMTGNKAYLAEYQDFNGGPVAFGGSKGYITGKGKIKTGKLDFEDVCFVKELQHFNLFFVSQMCDKKNKVLFTDSECLVLSPEFKLPDENQVLLRIPRQNNMYSFNLENGSFWWDFIEFCWSKGIKREYNNARTPQQNRVAERKNKTLIEAARTMLADSFLPNTFWAEAVSTACYVLNR